MSGWNFKVLSREDRESDRGGREDREGRRDRGERRRRDRDRDRDSEKDIESHPPKPVQGPIVLLKRPEAKQLTSNTAVSNDRDRHGELHGSAWNSAGGGDASSKSSGPTLILQRSTRREQDADTQHPSLEKGKLPGPLPVTDLLKPPYHFPGGHAQKLLDSNMKICNWKNFDYDGTNYQGNMDYLVITAIGRPNVGKSTILSYLAGSEDFGVQNIFLPRNRDEEMQSSIYISSDQIIFIEMSSVFNQAATNELIPLVSQQGVLEISNVTWNLRLVRWALSISHIILVISEDIFEPAVFQLMNSAEIIHSMDSALGEGSYPEPIYVCNKADLELLDQSDDINQFQKHFTTVTGRTPRIGCNYFVLPHTKYDTEFERFENFKSSIFEFNRLNRAPFAPEKEGTAKLVQKHSIQDWFQNATRLWDEMNFPNFFSSYVKLLP